MKNKSRKTKKPYMPRVIVKMNTGTRTMKSKKDKANTRQNLNKKTREEVNKSLDF